MDEGVARVVDALGLGTNKDEIKRMEERRLKKLEARKLMTNANEVEHTGNTGYGAELVPTNVLQAEIFDTIPKYGSFLPSLPGFHGYDMPLSAKVAVKGDPGFFQGNAEWTTGAGTIPQGNSLLPTGDVTITQAPFKMSIDLSKRELNYSIGDLQQLVIEKIGMAWARTAEAALINGDTTSGATGNVNSDDQAPATTFAAQGGSAYYALQIANGLRRIAIAGSGLTADVGTIDVADFISVANLLGDLFSDPSQCLWLFNRKTYNKCQSLAAFYDASQRGESSTINGKAITNIHGADLFIARDFGLTEADGKQSATGSNNTKGGFLLFYMPAVQHGYGQNFELDVVKVPGKGVSVIATVEWGFTIVQLKAGQADSSVGLAINATV